MPRPKPPTLLAGQTPLLLEEAVTETQIRCSLCRTYHAAGAFAPGSFYCKACVTRYQQRYQGRPRRGWDLHKYGITHEDYDRMWVAQGGVCAACGCLETGIDPRTQRPRYLVVDHDHLTGRVRALLCGGCNVALGHLREDPTRIRALLAYAERILIS